MPELLPMVATPVLPLVHAPPPGEEFKVVVAPVQTVVVPVIAPGVVVTLTVWVAKQPVPVV